MLEYIKVHLFVLFFLFSFLCFAQDDNEILLTQDSVGTPIEFDLDLDEIVISATRWKQFTGDIPNKISSISPSDVTLQNPQTAADLLGISGSVFIQKSQQGGGSPMIRGYATNRLLYTVDGVRMNTAIFRGGNIQNVINIDPFSIARTEVLFGTGSTLYGSDAIGGVMSFQTLKPIFSTSKKILFSGSLVNRYSSANNEQTSHVDINVGGKKWAAITSFTHWNFDNLRQGSSGPKEYIKPYYVQRLNDEDIITTQDNSLLQIPSAYSQQNMMQKIRYAPSKNIEFQYAAIYSETSTYGRYDRHNRVKNGLLRYGEWNYGPQKWLMNHVTMNLTREYYLFDELRLDMALQSFQESRLSRSLNKTDKECQSEFVDAYSLNLDLSKTFDVRHTLFYGVEYIFNDVTSKGETENIINSTIIKSASRYPASSWQSAALYLNNEYRLNTKQNIQLGVRYNIYQLNADFTENRAYYPLPFKTAKLNNGALTGTIGTVYKPIRSWVIKANIGTAFRSPNVDDIGKLFDSTDKTVTIPNRNLKAEYVYNFDVGVSKTIAEMIKIEVTGYYSLLKDALVRRNFKLNGEDSIMYDGVMSKVKAIQNAAEATTYGVQGNMEIRLKDGFSIISTINIQTGEEELDDGTISPSRHAAPTFGTIRLNYKKDKLRCQLYSQFQAEKSACDMPLEESEKDEIYAKDSFGNNYSPAWITLNAKLDYAINKSISISSGLENISDIRYRPYSSGISAPGRNFILSVKAKF